MSWAESGKPDDREAKPIINLLFTTLFLLIALRRPFDAPVLPLPLWEEKKKNSDDMY